MRGPGIFYIMETKPGLRIIEINNGNDDLLAYIYSNGAHHLYRRELNASGKLVKKHLSSKDYLAEWRYSLRGEALETDLNNVRDISTAPSYSMRLDGEEPESQVLSAAVGYAGSSVSNGHGIPKGDLRVIKSMAEELEPSPDERPRSRIFEAVDVVKGAMRRIKPERTPKEFLNQAREFTKQSLTELAPSSEVPRRIGKMVRRIAHKANDSIIYHSGEAYLALIETANFRNPRGRERRISIGIGVVGLALGLLAMREIVEATSPGHGTFNAADFLPPETPKGHGAATQTVTENIFQPKTITRTAVEPALNFGPPAPKPSPAVTETATQIKVHEIKPPAPIKTAFHTETLEQYDAGAGIYGYDEGTIWEGAAEDLSRKLDHRPTAPQIARAALYLQDINDIPDEMTRKLPVNYEYKVPTVYPDWVINGNQ